MISNFPEGIKRDIKYHLIYGLIYGSTTTVHQQTKPQHHAGTNAEPGLICAFSGMPIISPANWLTKMHQKQSNFRTATQGQNPTVAECFFEKKNRAILSM